TMLPTITSYVDHGDVGTLITLQGKNFADDATIEMKGITVNILPGRTSTNLQFNVHTWLTPGQLALKQSGETIPIGNFEITNKWFKISEARADGSTITENFSFVYKNKIYIALGTDAGHSSHNHTMRVFDPEAGTKVWTMGATIPDNIKNRILPGSFMLNDKVYFGSGLGTSDLSDWWEYDPSKTDASAWTSKGNYPAAGYGGNYHVVGGKAYVGLFHWGGTGINEFDPVSGNWTERLPKSRISVESEIYSSYFELGGKAYFGGGSDNRFQMSQKMYVFDPANFTAGIQELVGANCPGGERYGPTGCSTFTMNGKAYLIDRSGVTYEFDPAAPPASAWNLKATVGTGITVNSAAVVKGHAYCWNSAGAVYRYTPSY
ncbi:MAG: hypothetical protein J7578_19945, partial [Chitinophagaceae bacterium]|nr:hypothetical protein [Chitinophagaceae bacterium]